MPEIEIFFEKSIEQNAALYYEKAKRAKRKLEGATKALQETKKKLEKLEKEKEHILKELEKQEIKDAKKRKKEWFEKFHWFYSSEEFLCIGGRDATSNEIVIKKHTDKNDLVLHTDMAGSPFFVIKNGQAATEQTIKEAAQATASYSKAWKLGLGTLNVFYVKPEQVSKKTKAGEYMPKGAFMVYGQTKYLSPTLEISIGKTHTGQVVGGPTDAIKAQAEKYVTIVSGKLKTSDLAKKIKHKLDVDDVNEIAVFIPAGGSEIRK